MKKLSTLKFKNLLLIVMAQTSLFGCVGEDFKLSLIDKTTGQVATVNPVTSDVPLQNNTPAPSDPVVATPTPFIDPVVVVDPTPTPAPAIDPVVVVPNPTPAIDPLVVVHPSPTPTPSSNSQCSMSAATLCCNLKSKSEHFMVKASAQGCSRGAALVPVASEIECIAMREKHKKHKCHLEGKKKVDLIFVIDDSKGSMEENHKLLAKAYQEMHQKVSTDANDYHIRIVSKKGEHSCIKHKPHDSLYGFINSICGDASIALEIPKSEHHHGCRENSEHVIIKIHKKGEEDSDDDVKVSVGGKEIKAEQYEYQEGKSIEHCNDVSHALKGKEIRADFDAD